MTEAIKTITVDNTEYEVEKLSQKAQALVKIYQKWAAEAQDLKLELAKSDAALRDLSRELIAAVTGEPEAVHTESNLQSVDASATK